MTEGLNAYEMWCRGQISSAELAAVERQRRHGRDEAAGRVATTDQIVEARVELDALSMAEAPARYKGQIAANIARRRGKGKA